MHDEELDRTIQAARALAAKAGHASVTVDHLLRVLLGNRIVMAIVTNRGASTAAIIDRLDERLVALPAAAGAHSPRVIALDGDAEVFVGRLRGGLFGGVFAQHRMIRTLLALRPFTTLLAEARWYDEPVRRLHGAAEDAARTRGHAPTLVEHALLSLLDDPTFGDAVRELGHDRARVRDDSDQRAAHSNASGGTALGTIENWLRLVSVHANVARARALDHRLVVVHLLRHDGAKIVLRAIGIDAHALLVAYVHGRAQARLPPVEADSGTVDVVIYNDDFTTQEHVVWVLREILGLAEDHARQLMLEVHREGDAVVRDLPAAEAGVRVAASREASREAGMPLRIEIRD